MDVVEALAPYVPLFQTLVWATLIVVCAVVFRTQLRELVRSVVSRIKEGSSFEAGPLKFGEDLRSLQHVDAVTAATDSSLDGDPGAGLSESSLWANQRDGIYQSSRGVFLAHVIEPSEDPEQQYDIFIYLVRHKSKDFQDIAHAEFFFGHYWGNKVFRETGDGKRIGVSTSAYGPFLCTCRVTFKDGVTADIYRYIDFEMGRIFEG